MDINNYTPKYGGLTGRSLYGLEGYSAEEIYEILYTARLLKMKQQVGERQTALFGKEVLLVTKNVFSGIRIAFEIAVKQLCGTAITMPLVGTQIEALALDADFLPAIERYGVDGIVVNTEEESDAKIISANAPFPVISAHGHTGPCVALAAMLTCWEKFGKLKDVPIGIVGDMRAHNFILQAAVKCGMKVNAIGPENCHPDDDDVNAAAIYAPLKVFDDMYAGLKDCCAVFRTAGDDLGDDYFITEDVMDLTAPNSVFLHPIPVNRQREAEAAVCDGPKSAMLDMAENLLHVQKAVLALTIGRQVND
ncbi:MAG: hypothetical protein IJR61_07185 [Clostridia bacterium]|nr:hypothetical protein [Clostridia bacterium]